MPDFPGLIDTAFAGVLSTAGPECAIAQHQLTLGSGFATAAAWPSANLAIYVPVSVTEQITVYQMSIEVGAQAGNFDVGIYNEGGTRLVSSGSTVVGAAGLQPFNITDTILSPGIYYLAGVCSTVTTATFLSGAPDLKIARTCGVQQQATALPLPATATFANLGSAYIPRISAHFMVATV